MATVLENRLALGNKSDLTTPTSTRQYRLGYIYSEIDDTTQVVKRYIYVKSHAALTQYQPYVITNGGTAGSEWITGAPATLASAVVLVGVPQIAFTSGYYGFVQIEGNATGLITASTGYVNGNAMKVVNTGTSFVADSTGIAQELSTSAYLVATTTETYGTIFLPGNRVEITT